MIGHRPPEIKARSGEPHESQLAVYKPPTHVSGQASRRMAIAFAADLAGGWTTGVPAGSRIEPSERHGAVLVLAGGRRAPVRSHWCRALLMSWMDGEPVPVEHLADVPSDEITPAMVSRVIDWMVAEAWLGATPAVEGGD